MEKHLEVHSGGNKVFISSDIGTDGKNRDIIISYPYGMKTPFYTSGMTDFPEGTLVSFGLRNVMSDAILCSKANVVQGKAIDGLRYMQAAVELYNNETDNWPLGKYHVKLYRNGEIVTLSKLKIVTE